MILKYPLLKDKVEWNKRNYHKIPADRLVDSGYLLIGVAEDTFDLYVAFTNEDKDRLWIEKANKLSTDPICTKNFTKIDDDEFYSAHKFFVDKRILDGT